MNIEYDSSKFDSIIARSIDDAIRKYRKQMDNEGQPYTGIVVTERKQLDQSEYKNIYVVEAITNNEILE